MKSIISIQQIQSLKNEFREYLKKRQPDWTDSTVSTRMSDAFYALNNNVGIDFWTGLTSESLLKEVRDKIRDYFAYEKKYENPESRADSYLTSLRLLKDFLDENKPELAHRWSGKAVSEVYLKPAFQSWMNKQKKSNGEPYSPNTITAYTTALKNSTAKLTLGDEVSADLFYYISEEEFVEACNKIMAAPNFQEIDKAAGNKAYSIGLTMYRKFLQELKEPACWIFQANPKYYDIVNAVNELECITWAVNQSPKQIKEGDHVYIWVSGSNGGIIAAGKISCDPEMRMPDMNDPYLKGDGLKTDAYLAVDIQIERKLNHQIVERSLLLIDDRTKNMEILTYPGATNFRVTKSQEQVIESVIDGSYERKQVIVDPDVQGSNRYWMYAPGEYARFWTEFYNSGMMGIGWEGIGDLGHFSTRDEIKKAMKAIWDEEKSYRNDSLALWQFSKEMNPGDIVFVKQGLTTIIGRGVVESDYEFDSSRKEYKNIRKVRWTHNGAWPHPGGKAVVKTLTDITIYSEYVGQLEALFENEVKYPEYSETDFLDEVYISPERYRTLKNLLKRKKNIILQGAPGVGKTFAAQRLAFSIMGSKDSSRVKVVQFHQSYSYEDFIMGYRPSDDGFSLEMGPFYRFCKEAENDEERDYYFIIDEINRGNLSKIFGELLMLIEHDKRGDRHAIKLLYSEELFSVPENVHIVGMMNTADRSLAMIDYALRRRFAFFEMEPAFSSEGFRTYQNKLQNAKFDGLISVIERLNRAIKDDASLGGGFRIGHSYFCTSDLVDDDWIEDVIEYELVPLMNEYWFDEASKIEQWTKALRSVIRE